MSKNIFKTKKFKFFAIFCVCFIACFIYFPAARAAGMEEFMVITIGTCLNWIASFLSKVVGLAGAILDWILTPQTFGLLKSNAVINTGWTIIRDLVNMLFILILLVVAFSKVLGISKYQNADKVIIRLVIAAIMINFSKVLCGFFIDASNILTLFFIRGASAGGSIGENLANSLSIQHLFASGMNAGAKEINGTLIITSLIFTDIVLLVAAAAFLMLALMLVVRMVYIWILVMISPLAWAGFITGDGLNPKVFQGKGWWNAFIDYIMMAPTASFFLYLAIRIASTDNLAGMLGASLPEGSGGWSYFSNSLNMMLQYAIVITLMIMAYKTAKASGGVVTKYAAGKIEGARNKALDWGKRLGVGVAARVAEKPRAAIQKAIEKTPIIGEAIGDVGAYAAKQKAEIGDVKKLYTNRTPADWESILTQVPVTKKDMQKRTAMIELLASKGELKEKHKEYIPAFQKYGGDMGAVLGAKPEWAPDFYKYTKKEGDKPEDNLTGKPQEILDKAFAKMTSKKLAEATFKLKDIKKDDPIRGEQIEQAIKNAFGKQKYNTGHLKTLANSENVDLAADVKRILHEGLEDGTIKQTNELKKFFSSPASAFWEKDATLEEKKTTEKEGPQLMTLGYTKEKEKKDMDKLKMQTRQKLTQLKKGDEKEQRRQAELKQTEKEKTETKEKNN